MLFLVKQHKSEILDNSVDYRAVLHKTFNREFLNMMQVCVFVPFLHPETPKPYNITSDSPEKEMEAPQAELIAKVLNYRNHAKKLARLAQLNGLQLNSETSNMLDKL
jgi:hypothetical protein